MTRNTWGLAALVVIWMGWVSVPAATTTTDILVWAFGGVSRGREWISWEGRLNLQSLMPNEASALDIWPTWNDVQPTAEHARSELVLHRTRWDDPCMERLSFIAMANQAEHYRMSFEEGGQCPGERKGLKFCFEAAAPGGVPNCRLWVRPDGVWVTDDGLTWRPL